MKPLALITTIPSDSHHWNLIFIELLLKEHGFEIMNLGACVPFEETIKYYNTYKPEMLVVSTINGHGFIEGKQLINELKKKSTSIKNIFIGGNLSTNLELTEHHAAELENEGYTKAFGREGDLIDFKHRMKRIVDRYKEKKHLLIK